MTEQALSDVPLFGPERANIESLVEKALTSDPAEERLAVEMSGSGDGRSSVPFEDAAPLADKLKALRLASKQGKDEADEALRSHQERHEKMLTDTREMTGLSSKERYAVDHPMLLRAQEGYRFDFAKNQKIVADDPWLSDVWLWVAGKLATLCYLACPLLIRSSCQVPRRLRSTGE